MKDELDLVPGLPPQRYVSPSKIGLTLNLSISAEMGYSSPTTRNAACFPADAFRQEFTLSAAFNSVPKTIYQIRAVVTWTYSRTPGSIESTPVQYP